MIFKIIQHVSLFLSDPQYYCKDSLAERTNLNKLCDINIVLPKVSSIIVNDYILQEYINHLLHFRVLSLL